MKLSSLKKAGLSILLISFLTITSGCEKDQLHIGAMKQYLQANHTPSNSFDGGWSLTLNPDRTADVNPGGDIVYTGTYKISGSKIKVKTAQNSGTYNFEIINQTEIKEKKSGVILKLK